MKFGLPCRMFMLVAVFALGAIGCGSDTKPVIVGGNDPQYQPPADAQAAYEAAMKKSRQSANQN